MNKYKITIYLVNGQFISFDINDEKNIEEVRKDYEGFSNTNTFKLCGEIDRQVIINCNYITHIVINKGE